MQHLGERHARAVVLVPTETGTWYPRLRAAAVKKTLVAAAGEVGTFLADHHLRGTALYMFPTWGMVAVEVDFSLGL